MAVFRVTTTPAEVLELDDVKVILKDPPSTDDDYISLLITIAREWAETLTGLAFTLRTVNEYWDEWPSDNGIFRLALSPLRALTSMKYLGGDGTLTVFSPTPAIQSDLISFPSRLRCATAFPLIGDYMNGVQAVYTVGFDSTGVAAPVLPAPIKEAMLLMIADWYENRVDFDVNVPGPLGGSRERQSLNILRRYQVNRV